MSLTRALALTTIFTMLYAVVIFASALTFDYWQGWALFGTIVVCTLAVTAFVAKKDPALLVRRLETHEPDAKQGAIRNVAAVLFVLLFVVSGTDHRLHWTSLPAAVSIAADAIVAAAFYGVYWVFATNTFAASTVRVEEGQRVVSSGPYALVRHPMYGAATFMVFAIPLAMGSLCGIGVAFPFVVALGMRAVEEERRLATSLPGYDAYLAKVRYRLLPGIW